MNNDPGHEAAEEIVQTEQDNYYSKMVISVDNWTHCEACYVRRDHVYDSETKTWRCEFCGIVNKSLTQFRKAVTEVAEKHLEENPEEG